MHRVYVLFWLIQGHISAMGNKNTATVKPPIISNYLKTSIASDSPIIANDFEESEKKQFRLLCLHGNSLYQ